MSILASGNAPDLLRKYLLVGASSDSPVDYFVFAGFIGISADPLFIGVSHLDDLEHYGPFRPTVEPLALMACDWVDPHKFKPQPPADRDIDILMVSNWSQRKRHWLLFSALRKLPSNLRVILVGRNALGRTANDVIEEAMAFDVKQNIEFFTNIPFEQVTELMCRAKVFLALSRREGACVAVTESMFADTPVVMMADAHVGAKAHINESTGAVATRGSLPRTTAELIEKRSALRPRAWATQHISAQVSSSRLNETLKSYCFRRGLPWTSDIAPLCWDYVPSYLNPDDDARLSAATRDFEAEYGLKLLRFRYNSTREKPSMQALAGRR
jgi:glycosyltransferase involved in cell wall biosynthesis